MYFVNKALMASNGIARSTRKRETSAHSIIIIIFIIIIIILIIIIIIIQTVCKVPYLKPNCVPSSTRPSVTCDIHPHYTWSIAKAMATGESRHRAHWPEAGMLDTGPSSL